MKKYGDRCKCARCRYMANKAFLRGTLTYLEADGAKATWLEEQTSPSKPWALGCSVCRNALEQRSSPGQVASVPARNKTTARARKRRATEALTPATIWARTGARTKQQTTVTRMQRHARSATHAWALRELGKSFSGDGKVAKDRDDVPCLDAFTRLIKARSAGIPSSITKRNTTRVATVEGARSREQIFRRAPPC